MQSLAKNNFGLGLLMALFFFFFVGNLVFSISPYEIGSPSLTSIYVSPSGNDARDGLSISSPVKTLNRAWEIVRTDPSRGWDIQLLPGIYSSTPYFSFDGVSSESRPSSERPIIIRPAKGKGTVTIRNANIDTKGVDYFYIINMTIYAPYGDAIHFTQSHHLLIRNSSLRSSRNSGQETLKVNQAQYVYLEDNDIYNAQENAVDFVAVQYGHITRNKIHDSGDWCIYLKGGSANFLVDSNEMYRCGTGGFTAGQGSGFEYLVAPWNKYEAYNIQFTNNIVHDTNGAGIGVNGGYNILLAYNTLYKVGRRSHAIEVVYGARSCDGDLAGCRRNAAAGGWGPTTTGTSVPIPNKNVYIYNNIIYNPGSYRSTWQHFTISGPASAPSGSNVPSPVRTDENLQIRGNLIWNGPANLPIGLEPEDLSNPPGCQSTNPTCNIEQIRAENIINRLQPVFVNVSRGDYHISSSVNLSSVRTYQLSQMPSLSSEILSDRSRVFRTVTSPPGAYASGTAGQQISTRTQSSSSSTNASPSVSPLPLQPSPLPSTTQPAVPSTTPSTQPTTTAPTQPTTVQPAIPTNITSTQPSPPRPQPTPSSSASLNLPRSGNYVGSLRTINVNSEGSLRDAVNNARPGDVIKIAPGSYTFGNQMWIQARGTATNPIYIVADGARGSVRIAVPGDEGFNVGNNAAYLVFEDLEISNTGNNVFHVQGGSHHITLRNLNLHDAGLDGDVIKVNQAPNIIIEGNDVVRPGQRVGSENPYQEGIDLVDSADSIIRYNFVHDFGGIGAYAKGNSRRVRFEYNVIDSQRIVQDADPALGIGGWTDTNLLNGAQYEIYDTTAKHNLVSSNPQGGIALYDAYNATIEDNILLNNGQAMIQARAGNAPLATSRLVRIINNKFIDTRGSMPVVCQVWSHLIADVTASGNAYWNNGVTIPNSAGCGFVPGSEMGAQIRNPNFQYTKPTTYSEAMALLNWSGASIYSSPPTTNTTASSSPPIPPSTPAIPLPTTNTSASALPASSTTSTTANSSGTTIARTIRVYVAGESIEKRNQYTEPLFTSSGALNNPTNNDNNQFGWMVPFSERLKLRSPGLSTQFVGSETWLSADDNRYAGTYPSTIPGNTSAISGADISYWLSTKGSELRTKRFCYDIAFTSFGGNGFGWMSDGDYTDFMTQLISLFVNGSSCNSNPVIYVTGHMPDGQVTETAAHHRYVELPSGVVNRFNAESSSLKIRFIDMYTPFVSNAPTTAFPSPSWSTGGVVNQALISRIDDNLHPRRLASIYAGEIVANSINLSELLPSGTNTSETSSLPTTSTSPSSPPSTCTRACNSPQILNTTGCSCYTPASISTSPAPAPTTNTTTTSTPINSNGTTPIYSVTTLPVIPRIDASMKSRIRTIYLNGQAHGNRPGVFMKVGDSITESHSFLSNLGCRDYEQLGAYSNLVPTIDYFANTTFSRTYTSVWCETANSFTRDSTTAVMGWSAEAPLQPASGLPSSCATPNNIPLRCEIVLIRPSFAFIMYGTNDLQRFNDVGLFRNNLNQIITELENAGIVPVVSTIPPRLDRVDGVVMGPRVAAYNQIIIDVTRSRNTLLWNYWQQTQGSNMINQGMDSDGVHPNVYRGDSGHVFTSDGLRYGYNQRNLAAVQILEKLKRIVIDDANPDN